MNKMQHQMIYILYRKKMTEKRDNKYTKTTSTTQDLQIIRSVLK